MYFKNPTQLGELNISRIPKKFKEYVKFGIKNFKPFKEKQIIELKPLTIICGINNCGKSSLIQSLLLLSQSLKSPAIFDKFRTSIRYPIIHRYRIPFELDEVKYKTTLSFEGEFCHLSDYNNVINKYTKKKEISFDFCNEDIKYSFTFFNPQQEDMLDAYVKSIELKGRGYNIIITSNLDEKNQIIDYSCKIIEMTFLRFQYLFPSIRFLLQRKIKKKDRLKIENLLIKDYEIKNLHIIFDCFIPETSFLPIINFKKEIGKIFRELGKKNENINDILTLYLNELEEEKEYEERFRRFLTFSRDFSFLTHFLSSINYIGPLRDEPHRYYQIFDKRKLIIGNKGEFTPQILILEKNIKIPPFKMLSVKEDKLIFGPYNNNLTLKQALSKWLKKLDLPDIYPQMVEQSLFKIMINLPKTGISVTLPDVGYGISHILPVYIESLRMDQFKMLILEQPEIHLHPSMQSKLADFLISMAASGKRFIVETHSEHLINRICLRIAQDLNDEINDIITIVFIDPPKEDQEGIIHGSTIKKVKINKYGEIENWPVGFFDKSDYNKILKAGINKRKKEILEKKK